MKLAIGHLIVRTIYTPSELKSMRNLKIDSPAKALKEESMNRSFRKRFEEGLNTIAASLQKKGGTKRYEAVLKRIGKLEGRYPSIARYYRIDIRKDAKDKVTAVTWTLGMPERPFGRFARRRTSVRYITRRTTARMHTSSSGRSHTG